MKKELKEILAFRDARDWKQFHSPKNLAISLALEAAEILETFQWTADNNLRKTRKKELEMEMRVNRRRYPASKARGTSKKYNEL